MKLRQITPYKYIIKVANFTQYYNKNKMLQINWTTHDKTLVDLVSGKIIKRIKK